MGERAQVRRVCERAAFASIVVLGASCLNELEPSIAGNFCQGNLTNGVLDPGEECDDGNAEAGDGCDLCQVECPPPGRKDPVNAHCYLPVQATSFASAEDQCRATSRASPTRLLTVRSRREADFLRDVVFGDRPAGARPKVRTGYSFGVSTLQFFLPDPSKPQTQPPVEVELNFRQAAPSPFRAEPGLLAYYTNGVANTAAAKTTRPAPAQERPCSGCFGPVDPADGEAWWGGLDVEFDEPPSKGLAFDVELGTFSPVGLDDLDGPEGPPLETLCERVPNSVPRNEPCPGCPFEPPLRFRLGASIYSYFDETLGFSAAAERCAALGATLWVVDDEDERERVVRLLAAGSAPLSPSWPVPTRLGAWVGATRGPGGAFAWADGTPAEGERAVPWALEPLASWATDCGYVALRGDSFSLIETASSDAFAVGLVIPSACEPPNDAGDDGLPGLLCEQPAP